MRKIQKIIMFLLSLITFLMGSYTVFELSKRPDNTPKKFKRKPSVGRKIVACLGDSHTKGTMAHNFVNDLAAQMGSKGYDFINAGVNGDLVYNVLSRIDEIVDCQPDYIIILIGTNDILARLSKPNELHFELKKQLPQKPSEEWFIQNLRTLIDELKMKTTAELAILSLPLISEDCHSVAFKSAIEYSQEIQEVAREKHITYLPLNEKQLEFYERHRPKTRKPVIKTPLAYFIPCFKHYILRKSWEEISHEAGLTLTIDTVHQNKYAAQMIEQLIVDFLEKNKKD